MEECQGSSNSHTLSEIDASLWEDVTNDVPLELVLTRRHCAWRPVKAASANHETVASTQITSNCQLRGDNLVASTRVHKTKSGGCAEAFQSTVRKYVAIAQLPWLPTVMLVVAMWTCFSGGEMDEAACARCGAGRSMRSSVCSM